MLQAATEMRYCGFVPLYGKGTTTHQAVSLQALGMATGLDAVVGFLSRIGISTDGRAT